MHLVNNWNMDFLFEFQTFSLFITLFYVNINNEA